nr:synaptic vesicle glycoprotein 2A-like [Leptinotarsa decemlineata]
MARAYEKSSKTFEEAVSLAGFGKFNLYVLVASGGCLMCVIVETMCAMFITPAAQCDLRLSLSDKGLLYAISFLGVVSGSHLWGYLGDTKGRKTVTLWSLICSAVISFIGSLVSLPWLFIMLRFLNGFFVGGPSAIIYAYAGEFNDNRFRPKVVSWIATFVAFGNMYLPGMAWLILPLEWSYEIPLINIMFRPWRLLVVIYALPSILFAILLCSLPESPKYLISKGQHDEALAILRKMYSVNTGKSQDEFPVSMITWEEDSDLHFEKERGILRSMWEQTVPLFKKGYLLKTLMVSYLHFAIFFTSSAIIMWYPQILNSMADYGKTAPLEEVTMCEAVRYDIGMDNETTAAKTYTLSRALASKVCRDDVNEEVFLVSLLIGASYAVSYVLIGTFINIIGARRLLMGFLLVTTTSGVFAQLLSGYTYIQVTLGIFLLVATGIGVVNAVIVDLYPTQIRGMALAVSLMFGRLGAMAGSNTAGYIMDSVCDYLFYIYAVIHALAIIIVLLLPSQERKQVEVESS